MNDSDQIVKRVGRIVLTSKETENWSFAATGNTRKIITIEYLGV